MPLSVAAAELLDSREGDVVSGGAGLLRLSLVCGALLSVAEVRFFGALIAPKLKAGSTNPNTIQGPTLCSRFCSMLGL